MAAGAPAQEQAGRRKTVEINGTTYPVAPSDALAVEVPAAVEALGDDLEKARAANRQLLTGDERATLPSEIAAMMDPGDTFSPEVRRKLTERLNVELAELKNLRGLAGEDLKREAKIENLLGLFARLGEI